jgi:hypothetical protein
LNRNHPDSVEPPETLDGAEVLYWAWSAAPPFFGMPETGTANVFDVCGLAVCRYAESGAIYRFSCDRAWEVLNDAPYATVAQALVGPSGQFDVTRVRWNAREPRRA